MGCPGCGEPLDIDVPTYSDDEPLEQWIYDERAWREYLRVPAGPEFMQKRGELSKMWHRSCLIAMVTARDLSENVHV